MTGSVHLILDEPPHSGAWNMAVDAALLEESLRTGVTFVRMYRWADATISLGYFQKHDECGNDPRLSNLPCVRRLTGGGAILHHHEQTYSCCLPPKHPLADQPSRLYDLMHAIIIGLLHELGVEVTPRGHDVPCQDEPFLCFLRQAAPDLVMQGHKVLGSAQRRRRGAVLQHGSLLLRASEHASQLLGLTDLAPRLQWTAETTAELGHRLAAALGEMVILSDSSESAVWTLPNRARSHSS